MKKKFGIFMTLLMLLTFSFSQTAFAGTLNGYNNIWYTPGNSTSGNFYVNVTGVSWLSAQSTLCIENFASNVKVAVKIYRPNGTLAYSTLDTAGDYITMSNTNDSKWRNITFANGQTGNYRIQYSISTYDGTLPSSGRINCWIY